MYLRKIERAKGLRELWCLKIREELAQLIGWWGREGAFFVGEKLLNKGLLVGGGLCGDDAEALEIAFGEEEMLEELKELLGFLFVLGGLSCLCVGEELFEVGEVELKRRRDIAKQRENKADDLSMMFVHRAIHWEDTRQAKGVLEVLPCGIALSSLKGRLCGLKGVGGLSPMFFFSGIDKGREQESQKKENTPRSESREPAPTLPRAHARHQPPKHPDGQKDEPSMKADRIRQDAYDDEGDADPKQAVREVKKGVKQVNKAGK